MKLSVIGGERRAVATAGVLAEIGHEVTFLTADPDLAAALAQARAPFYEAGLATLLGEHVGSGRLQVTTDAADLEAAETHFLCVPAPASPTTDADLGPLGAAAALLAEHARPGAVIVTCCAAPLGTADWLSSFFASRLPGANVICSPDPVRPGHLVEDLLAPPVLLYGLPRHPVDEAVALLDDLRSPQLARSAGRRLLLPYAAAELVPLAAGARAAVEEAFADMLGEIALAAGIGPAPLLAAAAQGPQLPQPGLGIGGQRAHELDLFVQSARTLGLAPRMGVALAARDANANRPAVLASALLAAAGGPAVRRAAVLGIALDVGTDDVRSSPALAFASALSERGVTTVLSDPNARLAELAPRAVAFQPDPYHAAAGADLVVVASTCDEYRALDPVRLGSVVKRRVILDAAGRLPAADWRTGGWHYLALR